MEEIPWSVLGNFSAASILGVAVLGVFRGWLQPKSTVDQLVGLLQAAVDKEKLRGDEWKAVAEAADKRAAERDSQTERLMEITSSASRLLETLRRNAEEPR